MSAQSRLRSIRVEPGAAGEGGPPGGGYDVCVGDGALDRLGDHLHRGRRVLVVAQPGRTAVENRVCAMVQGAGAEVHVARVPDAEAAKDVAVLAGVWQQLGQAGFTRDDLLVGLGGGAVTDLAGFAAASWLRGVDVVHLPTSLLGVVDAAVGGKTGINTAEGKNLVGAFHQPRAVLCDPAWLVGMPRPDYASGLAEVVKCGLIADPTILTMIESDPQAAAVPGGQVGVELIAAAVQVKADVVGADPRESSRREILNFGHTLAHAIEQVEDYRWRHGDAVAVGMVFATELGVLARRTPDDLPSRLRTLLAALELPTSYRGDRWPELRTAMGRDKKARGSQLRFVVLDGLGSPGRLDGPEEEMLRQAYATVAD
ncbi:MAG: 3-dehydroquinate synthase [Ornithinimicrobium sp.]